MDKEEMAAEPSIDIPDPESPKVDLTPPRLATRSTKQDRSAFAKQHMVFVFLFF